MNSTSSNNTEDHVFDDELPLSPLFEASDVDILGLDETILETALDHADSEESNATSSQASQTSFVSQLQGTDSSSSSASYSFLDLLTSDLIELSSSLEFHPPISRIPRYDETVIGSRFQVTNPCHVIAYQLRYGLSMVLTPNLVKQEKFLKETPYDVNSTTCYLPVLNMQQLGVLDIESGTSPKHRNQMKLYVRLSEEQYNNRKSIQVNLWNYTEHSYVSNGIQRLEDGFYQATGVNGFFGLFCIQINQIGRKKDETLFSIVVNNGHKIIKQSSPCHVKTRRDFLKNSLKCNEVNIQSVLSSLPSQSLVGNQPVSTFTYERNTQTKQTKGRRKKCKR